MKPAPFDYVRPNHVNEVLDLLAQHGADARILAGGQSLIAMLNMRVAAPKVLIDIGGLKEMDYVRDDDGRENGEHVAVGCATTQAEMLRWPQLAKKLPLLATALPWVGHVQTRSRGTICGSIAHADPSSELPLCLALLGGQVVLRSRRRSRMVAASEFFVGALETVRRDDEMIIEVQFSVTPDKSGTAFNETAMRHGDFAIIAVGALVDERGIRVAIGGGADVPVVRQLPRLEDDELDDALNDLAWSLDCQDDLHASASYRRHLIRMLGRRTIEEAIACHS